MYAQKYVIIIFLHYTYIIILLCNESRNVYTNIQCNTIYTMWRILGFKKNSESTYNIKCLLNV